MSKTHAPGPRRLALAWRAGLRPGARWLVTAALFAFAAVLSAVWRPAVVLPNDMLAAQPLDFTTAGELAMGAAWIAAGLVAMGVLLRISVRIAVSGVGWVDRQALRRVQPIATNKTRLLFLILAGGVMVGSAVILVGVVAAASRSADASKLGIIEFYRAWCVRLATSLSVVLGVGGLVELAIERYRHRRSLLQTREQVADDRRERGGR